MSPTATRQITEARASADPPIWTHPEWDRAFPWLVQGITSAGEDSPAFDLGLFGAEPVGRVLERWRRLREHLGLPAAVHARQVHGHRVLAHRGPTFPGLLVLEGADAHVTRRPGILLGVSVADCVPVTMVDARRRAVAIAHAGWRGVAAGILEGSLAALRAECGSDPDDLWLHCGPAICGRCYEVGPEVHAAVWPNRPPPSGPHPIGLAAALADRALAAGVAPERLTTSTHCTRCGGAGFFSHRGGSAGRQIAFVGARRGETEA